MMDAGMMEQMAAEALASLEASMQTFKDSVDEDERAGIFAELVNSCGQVNADGTPKNTYQEQLDELDADMERLKVEDVACWMLNVQANVGSRTQLMFGARMIAQAQPRVMEFLAEVRAGQHGTVPPEPETEVEAEAEASEPEPTDKPSDYPSDPAQPMDPAYKARLLLDRAYFASCCSEYDDDKLSHEELAELLAIDPSLASAECTEVDGSPVSAIYSICKRSAKDEAYYMFRLLLDTGLVPLHHCVAALHAAPRLSDEGAIKDLLRVQGKALLTCAHPSAYSYTALETVKNWNKEDFALCMQVMDGTVDADALATSQPSPPPGPAPLAYVLAHPPRVKEALGGKCEGFQFSKESFAAALAADPDIAEIPGLLYYCNWSPWLIEVLAPTGKVSILDQCQAYKQCSNNNGCEQCMEIARSFGTSFLLNTPPEVLQELRESSQEEWHECILTQADGYCRGAAYRLTTFLLAGGDVNAYVDPEETERKEREAREAEEAAREAVPEAEGVTPPAAPKSEHDLVEEAKDELMLDKGYTFFSPKYPEFLAACTKLKPKLSDQAMTKFLLWGQRVTKDLSYEQPSLFPWGTPDREFRVGDAVMARFRDLDCVCEATIQAVVRDDTGGLAYDVLNYHGDTAQALPAARVRDSDDNIPEIKYVKEAYSHLYFVLLSDAQRGDRQIFLEYLRGAAKNGFEAAQFSDDDEKAGDSFRALMGRIPACFKSADGARFVDDDEVVGILEGMFCRDSGCSSCRDLLWGFMPARLATKAWLLDALQREEKPLSDSHYDKLMPLLREEPDLIATLLKPEMASAPLFKLYTEGFPERCDAAWAIETVAAVYPDENAGQADVWEYWLPDHLKCEQTFSRFVLKSGGDSVMNLASLFSDSCMFHENVRLGEWITPEVLESLLCNLGWGTDSSYDAVGGGDALRFYNLLPAAMQTVEVAKKLFAKVSNAPEALMTGLPEETQQALQSDLTFATALMEQDPLLYVTFSESIKVALGPEQAKEALLGTRGWSRHSGVPLSAVPRALITPELVEWIFGPERNQPAYCDLESVPPDLVTEQVAELAIAKDSRNSAFLPAEMKQNRKFLLIGIDTDESFIYSLDWDVTVQTDDGSVCKKKKWAELRPAYESFPPRRDDASKHPHTLVLKASVDEPGQVDGKDYYCAVCGRPADGWLYMCCEADCGEGCTVHPQCGFETPSRPTPEEVPFPAPGPRVGDRVILENAYCGFMDDSSTNGVIQAIHGSFASLAILQDREIVLRLLQKDRLSPEQFALLPNNPTDDDEFVALVMAKYPVQIYPLLSPRLKAVPEYMVAFVDMNGDYEAYRAALKADPLGLADNEEVVAAMCGLTWRGDLSDAILYASPRVQLKVGLSPRVGFSLLSPLFFFASRLSPLSSLLFPLSLSLFSSFLSPLSSPPFSSLLLSSPSARTSGSTASTATRVMEEHRTRSAFCRCCPTPRGCTATRRSGSASRSPTTRPSTCATSCPRAACSPTAPTRTRTTRSSCAWPAASTPPTFR